MKDDFETHGQTVERLDKTIEDQDKRLSSLSASLKGLRAKLDKSAETENAILDTLSQLPDALRRDVNKSVKAEVGKVRNTLAEETAHAIADATRTLEGQVMANSQAASKAVEITTSSAVAVSTSAARDSAAILRAHILNFSRGK